MKILHIHRNLPPDSRSGVAIQVQRLANAQYNLGMEVDICTETLFPESGKFSTLAFPASPFDRFAQFIPHGRRLWYPLRLRSLKLNKWDVIHIHGDGAFIPNKGNIHRTFYGTASLEARYARRLKDWVAQKLSYVLEKHEAGKFQKISVISPHIIPFISPNAKVIPCAIPDEPSPLDFTKKTNKPSWIFLGSVGGRKRGELAVAIAHQLLEKYPSWNFHYVGSKSEVSILSKTVIGPGWNFHTQLTEFQLHNLYKNSWVHLCLSSYEGFGVPSWEAMSFGCAALTTPHDGAKDWISSEKAGILVDAKNVQSELEHLLLNHEACMHWGEKGHRASCRFAPSAIAKETLNWYQESFE
jgi:glycosyltransferase involved in cell wall biosynthesis